MKTITTTAIPITAALILSLLVAPADSDNIVTGLGDVHHLGSTLNNKKSGEQHVHLPAAVLDGGNSIVFSLQTEEQCEDPGSLEFIKESLGDLALADGSLFSTFGLPVVLTDGSRATYPIPISQLADFFTRYRLVDQAAFPLFSQESEFFGRNSEHTAEIFHQHELATKFWKLDQEGIPPIAIAGLHSEDLDDMLAMAFSVAIFLGSQEPLAAILPLEDEDYESLAQDAMLAIEAELPNTYSNPALTFNAYATPALPVAGFPGSDLIVLGDGIMDFMSSIGLGEITNDILHAHEFGHVLQFIMGREAANGNEEQFLQDFFENVTPEESRKIELTADAYASYFLAHEQGRNFDIDLLQNAARGFFAVGDCQFDSEDHHGTPEQRECASLWGANLALKAPPGSEPIGFRELNTQFQQNIQSILNDDFSVCVTDQLSTFLPGTPPDNANTLFPGKETITTLPPEETMSDSSGAAVSIRTGSILSTAVAVLISCAAGLWVL